MDVNQERTWLLSIHVTDLSVEKTLRVNGDLHVGGVMFKLVESLGECWMVTFWFVLVCACFAGKAPRFTVGTVLLRAAMC